MGWLFQWLVGNFSWEMFLILGGAALLGVLKNKLPEHAPTIGYAFLGATCVAVLLFAFTGHSIIYKEPPPPPPAVSPDNIESYVKKWADDLAMSVERENPGPDKFFSYKVRLHDGDPVEISRDKEEPRYLQMKSEIITSSEHQAIIAKLGSADYTKFLNTIDLEIQRIKGMTKMLEIPANEKGLVQGQLGVLLALPTPIDRLDEEYFADRFDELTGALGEVRAAVNASLQTRPQLNFMPRILPAQ